MRLLASLAIACLLTAHAQSLQQLASPNRTLVVKFEHGTAQVGSRWLVDAGPLNGRGNYSESTWSTDGTEAGTRIVGPAAASKYVSQGSFAYYIGTNGKLIRTDGLGTPQGTQTLDAPVAGADLLCIAGVLYIVGPNGIQKTDGTAAGTVQLTPAGLSISQIVALGAKLLFVGTRAAEGSELWVSDGTVAGTTIVKDILPGTASSNPEGLGVGGGKAFFWAVDDPLSTRKLWSTDGTAAGTGWNLRFVRDLDGDGKGDVIWSHPDGRWAAWLMKGGTAVAYTYLQAAGSGAELIASEDYDGDGRDDLLWLDSRGGYSIWYMAGLTPKNFFVLMSGGGSGWQVLGP